jgi:hypothetical protein
MLDGCVTNKLLDCDTGNLYIIILIELLGSFVKYKKYAPSNIDDIDDLSWSNCGEEHYLKYYPSLEIELKNKPLLVHFDTGAHCTFFSFEELIEAKVIQSHQVQFTETARGTRPYHSANLNVEISIRCGLTGDTRFVHLKGQIVRDWLNSPFTRKCITQKCVQLSPINSDGKNCLLRIGLIGRNILVENKLSLVLDGKNQKTGIHSPRKAEI